jgi:uncharacterized protein YjeT (DUF2065 family)
MKILIYLIGLVLIVEGIPYFAFPDKMKKWMRLIQETPDYQLRIMGFISMCIGLLIAYIFGE